MTFAQLDQSGFRFTQTGLPVSLMKADYGDGFAAPAAVIGSPQGLRSWLVRIDVLPDDDDQVPKVLEETRSEYLWKFLLARKRESNAPFWVEDPKDGLFYLAELVDDEISFEVLCAKAYGTGLQLRQRRDREQSTPVSIIPGGTAPPWPEWGVTEFGN